MSISKQKCCFFVNLHLIFVVNFNECQAIRKKIIGNAEKKNEEKVPKFKKEGNKLTYCLLDQYIFWFGLVWFGAYQWLVI